MAAAIKMNPFQQYLLRVCFVCLFVCFFPQATNKHYENLTFTTLGNNYKGIQPNEQGSYQVLAAD